MEDWAVLDFCSKVPLKPCRQRFSSLCSGKASCGYPWNECFQASGKPTWETALWTHEMRNCNQQLITPSRPVRFAGGTANSKGQRKAGKRALFHHPWKLRHLAFSSNFSHNHPPFTYGHVLCVHTIAQHGRCSSPTDARDIKLHYNSRHTRSVSNVPGLGILSIWFLPRSDLG